MNNSDFIYNNIYEVFISIKAYFLLTIMIIIVIIALIFQILILPLYYINKLYYRKLTNIILNFTVPAFMAPLLVNKINIYINKSIDNIKQLDKNCVYMANHGGRIDWLISMFLSYCKKPKKVNFIAEITGKYLPFVGWYRSLCEDIYVSRSFNTDKEKIVSNIISYDKNEIIRDIYFSPEGLIADKNNYDISMIKDCDQFCKKNNMKPFKYVLTPRYKGLNCILNKNKKYYTFTVAYFKNGKLMNSKLKDKNREIPDLITLLKYNIDIYLYYKEFKIDKIKNNEDLKKKLLKRYKMHDKFLKNMDKNKEFYKNQRSKEPFIILPKDYIKKLLYFFIFGILIYRYSKNKLLYKFFKKIIKYIFLSLSFGHYTSEYISGYSRESIPFETLLKTILYRNRDKNKNNNLYKL